jgi:hypothetical protein
VKGASSSGSREAWRGRPSLGGAGASRSAVILEAGAGATAVDEVGSARAAVVAAERLAFLSFSVGRAAQPASLVILNVGSSALVDSGASSSDSSSDSGTNSRPYWARKALRSPTALPTSCCDALGLPRSPSAAGATLRPRNWFRSSFRSSGSSGDSSSFLGAASSALGAAGMAFSTGLGVSAGWGTSVGLGASVLGSSFFGLGAGGSSVGSVARLKPKSWPSSALIPSRSTSSSASWG